MFHAYNIKKQGFSLREYAGIEFMETAGGTTEGGASVCVKGDFPR